MSDVVVVDASLALKWILREPDSDIAKTLLKQWNADKTDVIAPGLFAYEITNILYRQVVAGKLSYDETKQLLKELFSIGISLRFSQYKDISTRAMAFAYQFSLSATYDAHYLALAEHENCEFWTADTRLLNALNGKLPWVRKLVDYQALS
jgi:predicted nucleic acid-binding protein